MTRWSSEPGPGAGTIDGVKTAAAGMVGFTEPPDGDDDQYAKLVQRPWVQEWMALDNAGTHIGTMSRPFAEVVLAPILIEGLGQSVSRGQPPTAAGNDWGKTRMTKFE